MRSLNDLILRNINQSRARTALTALSVSIGVAIVTASGVFQTGIEASWGGGEGPIGFISYITGILFTGVGGMILLAAGFLIFNAFAMTVTQRQQQIGMLRALGMSQKQVMRLVLYEALATGGIGTLTGLLLGQPFGQGILNSLGQFGLEAGQGNLRSQDILLAAGMGMGITLLASLTPARRAASVSPMTALREAADTSPSLSAGEKPQAAFQRLPSIIHDRSFWGLVLITLIWGWALIAPPGKWAGYHNPLELGIMLAFWLTWLLGIILLAPALLRSTLHVLKPLLFRFGGLTGRLAADNLTRNPSRLTLTALSFTIGVAVMIGTAGFISFGNDVLLGTISQNAIQQAGLYIRRYDNSSGVGQISTFGNTSVSQDVLDAAIELAGNRAEIATVHIVTVNEISSPTMGFPSFLVSASEVERFRRLEVFNLLEGDRDEMIRLMLQPGCAFTTSSAVAARLNAQQGDVVSVTGLNGKVDCTLAGVGSFDILPISVLSPGALAELVPPDRLPDTIIIHPLPDTDRTALENDIFQLEERFPGHAFVSKPDQEVRGVTHTSDQLMIVFNGMIFMGIVAAAFGMLNTVMVSILERQKEIGLLRAVGATRRQIITMLVLESTLTGFLGALLGAIAGLGIAALSSLTEGGVAWSLPNLDLYAAALFVLGPAIKNGWWSLIAAPLMAGLIAWPVARSAVRGSAVDALQPERR